MGIIDVPTMMPAAASFSMASRRRFTPGLRGSKARFKEGSMLLMLKSTPTQL